MEAGAIVRTAFCGPCFGARRHARQQRPVHPPHHAQLPQPRGLQARKRPDSPPSRSWTRAPSRPPPPRAACSPRPPTCPTRPGTRPASTASTTAAYQKRVYWGFGKADLDAAAASRAPTSSRLARHGAPRSGHPAARSAPRSCDPVTTTDELIPSGETSSYRSNPLGLAEFTLSRRDPELRRPRQGCADAVEKRRVAGEDLAEADPALAGVFGALAAAASRPTAKATEYWQHGLRRQARRRLRPRAGRELPARAGRRWPTSSASTPPSATAPT